MNDKTDSSRHTGFSIPPDDPQRKLATLQPTDQIIPHLGIAGTTYTILLTGKDTTGRFCLIERIGFNRCEERFR